MSAKIAVCQMRSCMNVQFNMQTVQRQVEEAAKGGAVMAFFPENFNYMGPLGTALEHAQPLDGSYMAFYKQLAQNNSIWLSLGGFQQVCLEDSSKYYNTHVVIDSSGNLVETYSKLHLFDVEVSPKHTIRESASVMPGQKISPPVETPCGKLGLSVCYDVRFPEIYRRMAELGAEILTVPAAFLERTGYAHWEVLLRARAIENACFVIASAQEGKHDSGRVSYGHSIVVDPWGVVVAQASQGPKVLLVDIDLQLVQETRGRIPVLNHLRKDVY